jgi:hypothetical protein
MRREANRDRAYLQALSILSLILAEMHECGSTRAKLSVLSF